jgi:putative transposase
MPREPRIEFSGAMYHVMNRGDRLEKIFEDDVDRETFLKTLGEASKSSGWITHSFILMNNHYHLLIETSRPTLVKGMQYLNSTYTRRYNVRHKKYGHLFQGRYKALLVDVENKGYFLTVSDYIHMNPVRAKILKDKEPIWENRWSSAGWLCGKQKELPEWIGWKRIYGELGLRNWKSKARREFKSYLERRVAEIRFNQNPEAWGKVRRGWCFGSMEFVEEMKDKLKEISRKPRETDSWAGEAVEEMEEDKAARLVQKGFRKLGYKESNEMKPMDRYLLARWIRTQTRVSLKWLASTLGVKSPGTVSYGLWFAKKLLDENSNAKKRWKLLKS